ncbi:MAG: hypothetical protein EPO20_18115 [Betaproteobacteria bacterium]|nr:MAG: hypothetical protein EPO20_18115 [Betaproteobacteria bacterium]
MRRRRASLTWSSTGSICRNSPCCSFATAPRRRKGARPCARGCRCVRFRRRKRWPRSHLQGERPLRGHAPIVGQPGRGVLELCVSGLSRTAARVFLLREMMGLSAEEICKELGISQSNCSVLLHRSRIRLRACLEKKWFTAPERTPNRRTS